MSFPPTIISEPANWYSSREGQPIKCIIAHDTERPSDASNSIAYLKRGGERPDGSDRKVSIHGLIEPSGDIYEMVPDELAANHAGYGSLWLNGVRYSRTSKHNVNTISLGFELEYTKLPNNKPYPEAQLLAMGWWVHTKRAKHGSIPVYSHAFIDPTRRSDPRNLTIDQIEQWVTRASSLLEAIPTPQKPINYRLIVPQVVYQAPNVASRFAGSANAPLVLASGQIVPIGELKGDWAWLATGWGFVPKQTLIKV